MRQTRCGSTREGYRVYREEDFRGVSDELDELLDAEMAHERLLVAERGARSDRDAAPRADTPRRPRRVSRGGVVVLTALIVGSALLLFGRVPHPRGARGGAGDLPRPRAPRPRPPRHPGVRRRTPPIRSVRAGRASSPPRGGRLRGEDGVRSQGAVGAGLSTGGVAGAGLAARTRYPGSHGAGAEFGFER